MTLEELFVNTTKETNNSTFDKESFLEQAQLLNRVITINDVADSEFGELSTGSSVARLIQFYNALDDEKEVPPDKREPIKIMINSYGGIISEAFAIIDAIESSVTPVNTYTEGKCYSAGFLIFLAGKERIATPHSDFLFHEGSISAGGNANQFVNYAAHYKKILNSVEDYVESHTLITKEKYKEIKDDFWFMSDEALELGVCTQIGRIGDCWRRSAIKYEDI